MPPVVPRDKSAAREAARSTADVARGKTGEDEVPPEEEEGSSCDLPEEENKGEEVTHSDQPAEEDKNGVVSPSAGSPGDMHQFCSCPFFIFFTYTSAGGFRCPLWI